MMVLVTGASGSGKSEYAEGVAVKLAGKGNLYYLATMRVYGEEGARRVERHRKLRAGKGFQTVECPVNVDEAFAQAYDGTISEAEFSAQECVKSDGKAWFVWLRVQDDSAATEEDLKYGIDRLLDACEPLFIQQTEDLSAYQMNFLHAITNGVHTGFTQTAILETYRLGTAANVTRLKKSLMVKDLITIPAPKHLEMSDPILALWLKRRVWKDS